MWDPSAKARAPTAAAARAAVASSCTRTSGKVPGKPSLEKSPWLGIQRTPRRADGLEGGARRRGRCTRLRAPVGDIPRQTVGLSLQRVVVRTHREREALA